MSDVEALVAFINARLDEEERVAVAATTGIGWEGKDGTGIWTVDGRGRIEDGAEVVVYDEGCPTEDQAEHIALHDPASVLRKIKAARMVLVLHRCDDEGGTDPICNVCLYTPPCETVRALALPYAEHPDYREEWRP